MQNPKKEIIRLRNSLIERIADLDCKLSNLIELAEFFNNQSSLNRVTEYRYHLAVYSELIYKDLIISLYKILDANSDKSIHRMVNWIENNSSKLGINSNHIIKDRCFEFQEDLGYASEIIRNLKIQRDKFFAHDDSRYFDNLVRLSEEANLRLLDINRIIELLKSLLEDIMFEMDAAYPDFAVKDFVPINNMLTKLSQ